MARKEIVKFVPTSLEMYLACSRLSLYPAAPDSLEIYRIIEGFVMNKPVDTYITMGLRKQWFKLLTLGLSNEQIHELVNCKG